MCAHVDDHCRAGGGDLGGPGARGGTGGPGFGVARSVSSWADRRGGSVFGLPELPFKQHPDISDQI